MHVSMQLLANFMSFCGIYNGYGCKYNKCMCMCMHHTGTCLYHEHTYYKHFYIHTFKIVSVFYFFFCLSPSFIFSVTLCCYTLLWLHMLSILQSQAFKLNKTKGVLRLQTKWWPEGICVKNNCYAYV